MNGGDISANRTNEEVSMSDDEKMFLYARAVHSNHSIQYHIHQIMEQQRVVDEYRNLTMEGMDLIPLESNLHKFHPVIISQIINMIELDNFWHHRTLESVMSDLRNMWTEGIQELENSHMYCTNNDENNNEMDRVEVIDLCSVSQSKYNITGVWILQGIYPLKDEWVFGCSLKTRLADQTKTQQLKWLWSKDSMNSTINQRLVEQTQEMNCKLEGSGGSTLDDTLRKQYLSSYDE